MFQPIMRLDNVESELPTGYHAIIRGLCATFATGDFTYPETASTSICEATYLNQARALFALLAALSAAHLVQELCSAAAVQ